MFRTMPFPFPGDRFPDQLGAVVQLTVLNGEEPAREVVHGDDGSWLVGDRRHDPNLPGAVVATHIRHAVERNSSMAVLASMPPGSIALREGPAHRWVVHRLEPGLDDA